MMTFDVRRRGFGGINTGYRRYCAPPVREMRGPSVARWLLAVGVNSVTSH